MVAMSDSFDNQEIEVERYELREPTRYHFAANRREFTQTLGAGLLITAWRAEAGAQSGGRKPRREELLSERFHLSVDGIITLLTSKVEVGQGSRTQLTQAAAEELRMPLDRIRLIMADTAQCPDDGGTAGSRTTPSTVPRVRAAAAALREFLSRYAAERWGVDVERVRLVDGAFETGNQRRLTIAELAGDQQLQKRLEIASPGEAASTIPVDKWKVLGSSVEKVGGREVVTGTAIYPSDVRRPGMLYGKVLRPVGYGAQLKSVDLAVASAIDGVIVVRDGDFIGCVAPTSWQAGQALDAIARTCQWDRPPHPSSDQLFEHLKRTANEEDNRRDRRGRENLSNAFAEGKHKIDSRYTVAYIQHAPLEPRAAVAEWQSGKLTVWTGTQQPSRVHRELCEAFRLPSASAA